MDIDSRIGKLIDLSSSAYKSGRRLEATGEERSQRIVRVGLHIAAQALENNRGDDLVAGDYLQSYVFGKLNIKEPLGQWPAYTSRLEELPPARIPGKYNHTLDELATAYARTTRKTVNPDGSFETDAMHAVHMMSLALPYAATHYPDLNRSKIAINILIHDLVEAYAGDITSLGITSDTQSEKDYRESIASKRIRTELGRHFMRLVLMLDACETLADDEARYTKTFDKLDPKFNSIHTNGISLTGYHNLSASEYEAAVSKEAEQMSTSYGKDYPDLVQMQSILTDRIIKNTTWLKPNQSQ